MTLSNSPPGQTLFPNYSQTAHFAVAFSAGASLPVAKMLSEKLTGRRRLSRAVFSNEAFLLAATGREAIEFAENPGIMEAIDSAYDALMNCAGVYLGAAYARSVERHFGSLLSRYSALYESKG